MSVERECVSFAEFVEERMGGASPHARTLSNQFFFGRRREIQEQPGLTQDVLEGYLDEYFSRGWNQAEWMVRANTREHRLFMGLQVTEDDDLVQGGAALAQIEKLRLEQDRKNQVSHILRSLGCQDDHDHEKICKAPKPRDWDADPPTVVMLGGGIGSGKSTVAKEFSHSEFWTKFGSDAVVVEADHFKLQDPLFNVLTEHVSFEEASTAVHSNSIHSANMLLLSALKYKRDVLLDGTMKWQEFVVQTLAMIRGAHERDFVIGKGYIGDGDEEYWRDVGPRVEPPVGVHLPGQPYRVWMVAVTSDPQVSIQRCIRRAVLTSRSVSMYQLLRSHRLFSSCFAEYCRLVDAAFLYDNTAFRASHVAPPMIASKGVPGETLMVLQPSRYAVFLSFGGINDRANDITELFFRNGAAE